GCSRVRRSGGREPANSAGWVKFLIDAQLPPRLARALAAAGHHAVHTLDLPEGNRTTDRTVAEAADADDRVLITKDGCFRDRHRLRASPRWLLIVTPATSAPTNCSGCSQCISASSSR